MKFKRGDIIVDLNGRDEHYEIASAVKSKGYRLSYVHNGEKGTFEKYDGKEYVEENFRLLTKLEKALK